MQSEYDVIVVGAGVIGAATARELSRFDIKVLVLEAGLDLACGATRANSGIVHAGFDPKPGTLKAKYNVAGAALFDQWQRELDFGFFHNGALVLAFDEADRATLEELLARAEANGVSDISIIDKAELQSMEPSVSPQAIAALFAPQSGICDPYGLTYAAAENAAANGVDFVFDARVVAIEREGDSFSVSTKDGRRFTARTIVNCAGVYADEINNLVSAETIEITPVKGEYLLYHNELAGTFKHTLFQVPNEKGKGVLVSSVLFGNLFIGPNAQQAASKEDLSTSEDGMHEILERAKRTWPGASTDKVIATYAGLRARSTQQPADFIVGEAADVPGFFNAACIDSPGLASAPAIAVDVARMVAAHLGAENNAAFNPHRTPAPLLAMMDEASKAELIAANPLYGVPVCKCCSVSEGELVDALHRDLPVASVDALKWRTGATMGPCHGGRCTARILQIMQRELGTDAPAIQKRHQGSYLVSTLPAKNDAGQYAELADQLRGSLEANSMREVGAGSLEITGDRPVGIYSALEAIELLGYTGFLPGLQVVVWGTHDLALRVALAFNDAGAAIVRVLESNDAPAGSPELLEALTTRNIAVNYNARVSSVAGASRLESATIVCESTSETIACDVLIASPNLVADE